MFGKQHASGLLRQLQRPETTDGARRNVVMTGVLIEQGNKMSVCVVKTQSNFRRVHGQSQSPGAET
jgi:hypothetical protein